MKRTVILAAAACLLAVGCKDKKNMDNPFFSAWNTPYEIPDFSRIKTEHYMPAFEEGMRQQKAEIDAIVNNTEAPTFENTILALEYSGKLLNEVSGVFFNLSECENSDEMEAIAEEVTPLLSKHGDDIALNAKLFERIKSVYDQRESLGLNPEQMRLVEKYYKDFVRGGANVPAEQQERFRQINEQIASLTLRFAQNVLKATNAYTKKLDDGTEVGLQLPSWEPFMQTCPTASSARNSGTPIPTGAKKVSSTTPRSSTPSSTCASSAPTSSASPPMPTTSSKTALLRLPPLSTTA